MTYRQANVQRVNESNSLQAVDVSSTTHSTLCPMGSHGTQFSIACTVNSTKERPNETNKRFKAIQIASLL
jgi:hypothetical protein